jgi:hypothetical protein
MTKTNIFALSKKSRSSSSLSSSSSLKKILCGVAALMLILLFGFPEASRAQEGRQTFVWDNDAAAIESVEELCKERGITSADVFRVNECAPLPSEGKTLLIPSEKSDLNAVWMEIQTQKHGGADRLVTIKLHGIPRKLRDGFPSAPVTPSVPSVASKPVLPDGRVDALIPPSRAEVSADTAAAVEPKQKPDAAQTAAVNSDKMMWPVDGKITSGFGWRTKRRFHHGIDIPMLSGTPIFAAQNGVVLDIGTNKSKKYRGYGNTALLDHGNGIVTLYAHCQSLCVQKGQAVKRGDVIGFVGSTGRVTTAHVHFEVRKDGKAVNPLPYLASR